MKNKLFSLFTAFLISVVSFCAPAFAQIQSEYDISSKSAQLQSIVDTDFMQFVNKHEMIGYRLNSYDMEVKFYKNNIYSVIEKFKKSMIQLQILNNSQDLSDTDKNIQRNNIYQDADVALYDLDAKTITFLVNCKRHMPTLTYQRFTKQFEEFYNAFHLSSSQVEVYY